MSEVAGEIARGALDTGEVTRADHEARRPTRRDERESPGAFGRGYIWKWAALCFDRRRDSRSRERAETYGHQMSFCAPNGAVKHCHRTRSITIEGGAGSVPAG